MSGSDKTEKPTPKKKREARKEGRIAKSQDVVSWSLVLLASILLPGTFARGRAFVVGLVDAVPRAMAEPEPGRMLAELSAAFRGLLGLVLPVMAALCALAVVGNLAQTGFVLSTKAMKPTLSRLNPAKGLKRLFSVRSLWETGKQLLRLAVIMVVAWPLVRDTVQQVSGQRMPLWDLVGLVGGNAARLLRNVAVTALVLAAADYVFQRKQTNKGLKMTKQEVKEEYKQAEGNSEVKGKIKSLQLQASRNRMMAAIADANVVVVNPVHIAVALRYTPGMGAPRVVAKGAGAVAERIRDKAAREDVPIVESIPLARALHRSCELDQEIPVELYEGVARLLAFVQRLASRTPLGGGYHKLLAAT